MFTAFLIKYAEIGVKGKNKYLFEEALAKQVKYALKRCEGEFKVTRTEGRIYVHALTGFDFDETVNELKTVFGISGICPVIHVEDEGFEKLSQTVIDYMNENYPDKNITFKVNTRRARKNYPMDSQQVNREMGGVILDAFPEMRVDVHHPDVMLHIEIREKIYIYSMEIPGPGGMPVGSNGKAMLLLSGGIDSPVAGYMIAKRGVEIECIHFFSYPYTSELAKEKVLELAHIMTKFCGRMTVDIVGFTEIQEAIRDHCREEYFTIIMRRFMMRIAEAIGRDHGAKCLVTGENLGQVASQTMDAMAVTGAVVHMPIFHPLIGMDKEEIVAVARRIGTLDTSILPYEDCCTVFTPKHPKTKPVLAQVEAEEQKLDVEGLIARAIANTEKTQIRYYEDEHKG